MVRLSLSLLVAVLLQTASSLPLVEEIHFTPTSLTPDFPTGLPTGPPTGFPTSLPSEFPTDLPTGIPTNFPTPAGFAGGFPTGFPGTGYPLPTGLPHRHPPHHPPHYQPEEGSKPIPMPEKRNLPVTPKWLRWLPFENINIFTMSRGKERGSRDPKPAYGSPPEAAFNDEKPIKKKRNVFSL